MGPITATIFVSSPEQTDRFACEIAALEAFAKESGVFEIERNHDIARHVLLVFRGRGLAQGPSSGKVRINELHKVLIGLAKDHPVSPPTIRFLTPCYHPNLPAAGEPAVEEIGMTWSEHVALDLVAERLWDAIRWAWLRKSPILNEQAEAWRNSAEALDTPLDHRALRNARQNVISYRWVDEYHASQAGEGDILYINEGTPTPELPLPRRRPGEDDGVLFIGDE